MSAVSRCRPRVTLGLAPARPVVRTRGACYSLLVPARCWRVTTRHGIRRREVRQSSAIAAGRATSAQHDRHPQCRALENPADSGHARAAKRVRGTRSSRDGSRPRTERATRTDRARAPCGFARIALAASRIRGDVLRAWTVVPLIEYRSPVYRLTPLLSRHARRQFHLSAPNAIYPWRAVWRAGGGICQKLYRYKEPDRAAARADGRQIRSGGERPARARNGRKTPICGIIARVQRKSVASPPGRGQVGISCY